MNWGTQVQVPGLAGNFLFVYPLPLFTSISYTVKKHSLHCFKALVRWGACVCVWKKVCQVCVGCCNIIRKSPSWDKVLYTIMVRLMIAIKQWSNYEGNGVVKYNVLM